MGTLYMQQVSDGVEFYVFSADQVHCALSRSEMELWVHCT